MFGTADYRVRGRGRHHHQRRLPWPDDGLFLCISNPDIDEDVSGCGSPVTNVQNITINGVYFHDDRRYPEDAAGNFGEATHSEMWKIDCGSNVTFQNNWFQHCGAQGSGTTAQAAGCNSAVMQFDNDGSSPTATNFNLIQNCFCAGDVEIGNGSDLPDPTSPAFHVYFNTFDGPSNICVAGSTTGCTATSAIQFVARSWLQIADRMPGQLHLYP